MMLTAPQLQPVWLDATRTREGRYVLGPFLGKGGMGEVVEAWDVVLCRTVALKILRNMEPTALIRFMHEAQIQARVAHPHICRIYDVDSSEGTVKIAMQLIRGPSLEQACRDLSVLANVTLVAEVAEAVHAAHQLKLIHRDLKPSNILLEKGPNGRWLPYICDFGLAMSLDEPALTLTGGAIGTPAYMAPEQFHGLRSRIGPPTDVYALGGTLHFALLGRPPDGPTLSPRLNLQFPDPNGFEPEIADLPGGLQTILAKCLEEDPALRYPSAGALAEDLWRFVNGEPVQGSTPGLLRRIWGRTRRQRRTSAGSALVLGTLLGGWGLEGLYLGRAQETRAAMGRSFALEAEQLDRGIRLERMLPAHDLRPAYRWFQTRMDTLRARMEAQGSEAREPGHLALARIELLLGNPSQARQDAFEVWRHGSRNPEAAYLLAMATGRAALAAEGAPDPSPAPAQEVEALFKAGRDLGPADYPGALVAFLRKDYATAANSAGTATRTSPWDPDAASLEALSHCAIAIQRQEAADLPSAESECRQAMAISLHFLEAGRSDEQVYHAYFLAARWLVSIQGDQGVFAQDPFKALMTLCDQALRLNPDHPGLQEDWLSMRFLKAEYGQSPAPETRKNLEAALVFLATRAKEPLSPGLRNEKGLILWALAKLDLSQGADPAPLLAEAGKVLTPAPFLRREYLAQMLNDTARFEASRGVDPRPTLDQVLTRLDVQLKTRAGWSLLATLAETWLIRGEWERAKGLQATASFHQCEALSDEALKINPGSAFAQALNGLARLRDLEGAPDPGRMLRAVALERLRAARTLPADRQHHPWLQPALARAQESRL